MKWDEYVHDSAGRSTFHNAKGVFARDKDARVSREYFSSQSQKSIPSGVAGETSTVIPYGEFKATPQIEASMETVSTLWL